MWNKNKYIFQIKGSKKEYELQSPPLHYLDRFYECRQEVRLSLHYHFGGFEPVNQISYFTGELNGITGNE
jgi:hypothetical protein